MEKSEVLSVSICFDIFTVFKLKKKKTTGCVYFFKGKKISPHIVAVWPLSLSSSFATPWTVACLVPLSMGFPRQECWSGLPFPSPGDLPNPGIEPFGPWIIYH